MKVDDEDATSARIFGNMQQKKTTDVNSRGLKGRQNSKCIVIVENKYNAGIKRYGVGFGICNAKCIQKT